MEVETINSLAADSNCLPDEHGRQEGMYTQHHHQTRSSCQCQDDMTPVVGFLMIVEYIFQQVLLQQNPCHYIREASRRIYRCITFVQPRKMLKNLLNC